MESNTWCPRLTAAMILSGSAVHVKDASNRFTCPAQTGIPLRDSNAKIHPLAWTGPTKGETMATSLYDLSVPTFLQTVRAVAGCLQRAAKHCAETGADPDDFVHTRLIADMAPFHFQIEALSHHSVWGLEAVKTGIFAPPALIGAMPFAGLRALIDEAIAALEALTPAEVNGWAGKALNIEIGRAHV